MLSNNMNTFIVKVFVFGLLLLVVFGIGLVIPDKSTIQNLHYSIIDKQRLLQEVSAPRLILVGGSNLSFGINSKRMQDSLNINVINAGIRAQFGLKFIFDYIGSYIKDGDTVIVIPEYELFFKKDGVLGDAFALLEVIDVDRSKFSLLSFRQILILPKAIPKFSIWKIKTCLQSFLKTKANTRGNGLYDRKSFNRFGDVDVYRDHASIKIDSTALEGDFNPAALKLLKEFRKIVEMKNGCLYMSYPSFNYSSYKLSETKIRIFEQKLIENNFVILGNPERYSFPDSLYFDTKYHLITKGADIRTELLIKDLKKHGL